MTAMLDVTPKTTEHNRIVRTDKSEAGVTNHYKLRSRYCTVEAMKLTTDSHEASRGLFATAELLVNIASCDENHANRPITRRVFLGRLLVALKRDGFILADVQTDALSLSGMIYVIAFHRPATSLRTFYDTLPQVSMTRCIKSPLSRHFRRSYLNASKVSKSEAT